MTLPEGRKRKDCRDPWTGVVIGANGDVAPCCHTVQRMGNVADEAFDDIWAGPRFRTFRAFLQTGTPLPACATCFVRPWRSEPLPPPGVLRAAWQRLVRSTGVGRGRTRLRVWTDRSSHRAGEPLSFSVGLEAGRLRDGGRLDLYLRAEDATGTRHFVTFDGRLLQVVPRPTPLLGGMEPLDFEWLELRGTPPRDWPLGEWRVTAVLTPTGRGVDDEPSRHAQATSSFSREA
ncbi:MAG: SPASM domain-containing protein [Deltaproteobacteria bacterium]|nr:SPASM domain-containing protein [Deltaproteobacteria bacterium]